MLYLIGIGFSDGDISLKAVEAIKKCDAVYAEDYTNKYLGDIADIEKLAGKKIDVLKREGVESDFLVNEAKSKDVALLVPGDPLSATTHLELLLEAKRRKIKTALIHSASIFTAAAESGLQLYKFGRATTLPFPRKGYPDSPFDVIEANMKAGLHTLVLLDTERNDDGGAMTAAEGAKLLLASKKKVINKDTQIIACCRLGADALIAAAPAAAIAESDEFDKAPACLLIPGKLNFKEEEFLQVIEWKQKKSSGKRQAGGSRK